MDVYITDDLDKGPGTGHKVSVHAAGHAATRQHRTLRLRPRLCLGGRFWLAACCYRGEPDRALAARHRDAPAQ